MGVEKHPFFLYYLLMLQIKLKTHPEAKNLLLTKFLWPNTLEHYKNDSNWEAVLGEKPENTINNFLHEGLIIEGKLFDQINGNLTIFDLKNRLRNENLKLTGTKPELINRLLDKNSDLLAKEFAEMKMLICSRKGANLANQFKKELKDRLIMLEIDVLDLLKCKEFIYAIQRICDYEINQVFPRGLNYETWHEGHIQHYQESLIEIFIVKPKILKNIENSELEILRPYAGMILLFGKNRGSRVWLPRNFVLKSKMNVDSAARMLIFYSNHKSQLRNFQNAGFSRVQILTCGDSCKECQKLDKKIFQIDGVIELPFENCTHKYGCRCCYIYPIFTEKQ